MIAGISKFVAIALILGTAPTMTLAQENNSQQSFEVSSLRLSSLPIPTSRAQALGTQDDAAPDAATAPKIRRTADGIRIVGAVYFPEDRN